MPKLLSERSEIRQWAEARAGYPMLMDMPDVTSSRALLQITFGQHALNSDRNEGPDPITTGYQLVSWDDWFAELDRQGLVLRVNDDRPGRLDNDFEFVARGGGGETTDAARQPPVVSVEDPGVQGRINRGE